MTASEQPLLLGDLFRRGRNSFSVIRLLLATAVIVSHSYYLPGYGTDFLEAASGLRLGGVAVDGFFALSGMLVTASLVRNRSIRMFVRHRLARLMPGFWVCLAFCAFVLAPVMIAADHGADALANGGTIADLARYVVYNAALVIFDPVIPGVLGGLDYRRVNPCLWTLAPEAACYAMLALAGLLGLLGRRRRIVLGVAFAAGLVLISGALARVAPVFGDPAYIRLAELGMHFFGGVLTVLFLSRMPLTVALAIGLAVLYVLTVFVAPLQFLRVALLAPLIATAGRIIPLHGVCDRTDVSYGLYLYGSAIQQFLVWSQFKAAGPWSFFALSFAATLPIAFLSWNAVERPMLSRWGRRSRAPDAYAGEERSAAAS